MRIYIRTPFVDNSNIVPHTVEHCVGNVSGKKTDFFDYYRGLYGEVKSEYTCLEFDRWIKYDYFLQKMLQPIEKDTVIYERKVLKEELSDPTYIQKIYEKVIQKFVNPKLTTNRYKAVSLNDLKDYHKKYYKPENLIVVDEEKDYKIIFEGFIPKEKKNKKLEKKEGKFKFEGNEYLVCVFSHYNGTQYWTSFFSYRLLNCYCYYINRLHKQGYYNQENYFFQYADSCIIMLENLDYSGFTQEFFEQGKKYFINILKHGYYQEKFFLNEYFYDAPKTRKEAIQVVKDYSREEFREF